MNLLNSILAVAFLLLAIVALDAANAAPPLRAGAAVVDITPRELPINMPGGFNENPAEGINDPLHARALVFEEGGVTLALVVVDNLGVVRETVDEAKALAARQCGIPMEKILLSSTHTHSGPPSSGKDGSPQSVAYRKILVEGIAKAIVLAKGNLRPAAVGDAARPLPGEVFNRRWFLKPGFMKPNPFGLMDRVKMNPGNSPEILDHPDGPTDPNLTILSVQDAKTKKPLALLANYSLHYVGGLPRGKISADYYGEFARLMPFRLGAGEGFVAMMSNGTSGDVNNHPFGLVRPPREPFEQIRIVAGKAADTAWLAWKSIGVYRADAPLGMIEREVTLRLRRPTVDQIKEAKAVLAVRDEAARAKLPSLADAYARRVLALAEGGKSTLNVPLQVLRIGDLAVCAIPFETFAEIGLELKRRSPLPRTMVMGNANGYNGYLPTPAQHKLGGYETWLGTNKVQETTSDILIRNLLEMLAELAKANDGMVQ